MAKTPEIQWQIGDSGTGFGASDFGHENACMKIFEKSFGADVQFGPFFRFSILNLKTTAEEKAMYDDTTRQELREAFRQIVLTLGGIFSLYEPDDSLVWAVTRNLDRVFEAHLGRGSDVDHKARGSSGTRSRPHPAVVELLKSIERLAPEQQEHPRT